MKKWLIGIPVFLLLCLLLSYFLIPEKIVLTKFIVVNNNHSGVFRFLSNESNWQKWWPGTTSINENQKTTFNSGSYQFRINETGYNSFEISIEKDKNSVSSLLQLFPLGVDSINIEWNATIITGSNPFSKIRQYLKARELSNNLETIVTAMQKYISNVKNIYGIDVKNEKVMIEYLVSVKKTFSHYPDTEDVYDLVNQIKKYIGRKQAKEEDYPMLHINTSDSTHFEVQVAIPVNKQLADSAIFSSKKMLKFGNILAAEVTGGKNAVDSAMKQMDSYANDHQYTNIALPFQSLVTDRTKESDSGKWLTRIYYPVL